MNLINSLIIEGTAENFKSNENFAEFQISAKRFYRNANGENVEETNVFDCEAWGNLKDCLVRVFDKKSERPVRVVGRLKQHIWKDETGKKSFKSCGCVRTHRVQTNKRIEIIAQPPGNRRQGIL